jgi:hypothetical protein
MVSFRLSEREYENLMALCAMRGSRSLSDLARDAMQRLLKAPRQDEPLEQEVQRLNGQLEQLDREVRRLAQLVQSGAAEPGGVG